MNPPFISERRLYLTKEGKVCEENDPQSAFLLVGEGGKVPYEEAKRLGLLEAPPAKPQAPAAARKLAKRGGD